MAVSNYDGNGHFYFFFDVDDKGPYAHHLMSYFKSFYPQHEIYETKHGLQFYGFNARDLGSVKALFDRAVYLCRKDKIKTDYYWTVPLWLRTSAKWTMDGDEVSKEPESIDGNGSMRPQDLKMRKLYRTWD